MNETATGIGISRLGQIAVNAHDTGRATEFYRDVLGFIPGRLVAPGQIDDA